MKTVLSVEHIQCGYGKKIVVQDAAFSVAEGEFCALLGLNGCGKSTLLKALDGLIPIRQGRCLVGNEDCTRKNERERALCMSYIPQRGSLITGKSVEEVVLMGFNAQLKLLDSPGKSHKKLALDALELLGMAQERDRDYAFLSEGQKQLVILARAMVQNTPVMLLDEPDSALDFVNRNLVLGKIKETLKEQKKAGLITLHDPNFAMAYCDRLFFMKEGTIVTQLSLKDAGAEEVQAALSKIYGAIRVLPYEKSFVMVRS